MEAGETVAVEWASRRIGGWLNIRSPHWRATGAVRDMVLATRFRLPAVLLWLALLAAIAAAIAFVFALITPVGSFGIWQGQRPSAQSVESRQRSFAAFDPFFRTLTTDEGGVISSGEWILYGIRLNESSGGGSAILGTADGEQTSYAVGDEVAPGVTLARVAFDHIVLSRGGLEEKLFIDQSDGADASTADGAAGLEPVGGGAQAAVSPDPSNLMSDIEWLPRNERGRVTGIIVRPKGSGAAFRAVGFEPDDVIVSINDRPINSAGDLASLAERIKSRVNINMLVERGSETTSMQIYLED